MGFSGGRVLSFIAKVGRLPVVMAWVAWWSVASGIETTRVDLKEDADYDGEVSISRLDGELLFDDASTEGPVSLQELRGGTGDHGALTGLGDDDHSHYLNAARHSSAHSASFNSDSPIVPDVHGNATIGEHVQDGGIHLNRALGEIVTANWEFAAPVDFTGGNLYLANGGSGDPFALRFANELGYAALTYFPQFHLLHFGETFSAGNVTSPNGTFEDMKITGVLSGSSGGSRAGNIDGFLLIEGIAYNDLLSRSRAEDIAGQWDFLQRTTITAADATTAAEAAGLDVAFSPQISGSGTLTNRRRAAMRGAIAFNGPATGSVSNTKIAGVLGEASAAGTTSATVGGTVAGIWGEASTQQASLAAVGVAGAAGSSASGAKRIGILGASETASLTNLSLLPAGTHAGVFLGDTYVQDGLSANGVTSRAARWRHFHALATVGLHEGWFRDGELATSSTGNQAWFPIPYEPGTVITKLRIKWIGGEEGCGLHATLVKRDESSVSTGVTVVATQTYMDSLSVAVETYTLPVPETMTANSSYSLVVESISGGGEIWLLGWGLETSGRVW